MDLVEKAARFRPASYQPEPQSIWHRLPVSRRASVFVLLFLGKLGELRVVLTKRLSKLRNFPGHISLPGGKADLGLELPWMVARREMAEEIGVSDNDAILETDYGFRIRKVTELPCYLSRTFSAVRPCVGFMDVVDESHMLAKLKLALNPGESLSIFLCPLQDFLYPAVNEPPIECLDRTHHHIKWGGIPWHLRSYTFKQANADEAAWLQGFDDVSALEELSESDHEEKEAQTPKDETDTDAKPRKKQRLSSWGKLGSRRDSETNEKIYDVWGLTANILHDLAEVVYTDAAVKSEAALKTFGEEELIWSIWKHGGQMKTKERSEIEAQLIVARPDSPVSFGDVLPRTEFNRLKRVYKM